MKSVTYVHIPADESQPVTEQSVDFTPEEEVSCLTTKLQVRKEILWSYIFTVCECVCLSICVCVRVFVLAYVSSVMGSSAAQSF
eukprot:Awhi_evm1s9701